MNYRSVSAKSILERVFSRYGTIISQDSDRLVGNAIEWIGDGLEAIGILSAMGSTDAMLEVKNGRIELPCNLYLINSVAYKGQWLPYGSQSFNYDLHCTKCVNEHQFRGSNIGFSYTVNPNYLMTNVPDGDFICISHDYFEVDEEGYPLVPDRITVKTALFWYITMTLMLGGFTHPDPHINFQIAEAEWLKYCTQAENDLAMFDKPRMITFKNNWTRLFSTSQFSYLSFFAGDKNPEVLPNQKYNNRLF